MYKARSINNILITCLLFMTIPAIAQSLSKNKKGNNKRPQASKNQLSDPAFRTLLEKYGQVPGGQLPTDDRSNISTSTVGTYLDSLNPGAPVITENGTPIGYPSDPVLIGKAGGMVLSPDSMLQIIIPEGALASDTYISIQPISNNAPLGAGNGYRLLPDGTSFTQPVQLVFKYNDDILDGTCKEMLCIETQDKDGSWNVSRAGILDTIAKTITETTLHFSDWSIGAFVKLILENQPRGLSTVRITHDRLVALLGLTKVSKDYDDDLAPLTPIKHVGIRKITRPATVPQNKLPPKKNPLDIVNEETQSYKIKKWTLNGLTAPGVGKDGKLTPGKEKFEWYAIYTAPANLPSRNPVAVSVELTAKAPAKGQFVLTTNILVADYHMNLTIDGKLIRYTEVPVVSAHTIAEVARYPNAFILKAGSTGKTNPFSIMLGVNGYDPVNGTNKSLEIHGDEPDQFAYFPDNYQTGYGNVGKERKKTENGGCEETEIGNSFITVTESEYLGLVYPQVPADPTTNPETWAIKGTINGTLYEDNATLEKNCQSSIPHPYTATFYLQLFDFRKMGTSKKR